jgi:hypothetical protein
VVGLPLCSSRPRGIPLAPIPALVVFLLLAAPAPAWAQAMQASAVLAENEAIEVSTFLDALGPALGAEASSRFEDAHAARTSRHVGLGPMNLPSQAPGQVLRLGLRPRTPSTLARHQREIWWTETFANIFAFEQNDYLLDYLTLNSTLSFAYGLTDRLQVDLALGNLLRTDSFLDPITDAFHDLFGFGDAGRDRFPERDNIIDLEPQDGIDIEDRSSGTEATHLTLSLQQSLTDGTRTWPALAASASVRWDAGGHADLEGDSRFSTGLTLSAARRLGEAFHGYLGLGYNWHGLDESRGLALTDEQWSGLAAVEWRRASNRSWVLQYLVSEAVSIDRAPFDKASHELNLGWKWEFKPGTVFEIGLIENIVELDNSPDFGLHFGIQHRS